MDSGVLIYFYGFNPIPVASPLFSLSSWVEDSSAWWDFFAFPPLLVLTTVQPRCPCRCFGPPSLFPCSSFQCRRLDRLRTCTSLMRMLRLTALPARKSAERCYPSCSRWYPDGLLRAVLAGAQANVVTFPGPLITANKVRQPLLVVTAGDLTGPLESRATRSISTLLIS